MGGPGTHPPVIQSTQTINIILFSFRDGRDKWWLISEKIYLYCSSEKCVLLSSQSAQQAQTVCYVEIGNLPLLR